MPIINWNVVFAGLLYAALTGLFNFAFAHKSQIETWSLTKPRLAAFLKLTRAIGLDPWNIAASALLLFQKRLPVAQQNGVKAIAALVQTEATPPSRMFPSSIPPAAALLLAISFAFHTQACSPAAPPKAPCDSLTLAAIDAECSAQAFQCGKDGIPKEKCTAIDACKKRLDDRKERCSQ